MPYYNDSISCQENNYSCNRNHENVHNYAHKYFQDPHLQRPQYYFIPTYLAHVQGALLFRIQL